MRRTPEPTLLACKSLRASRTIGRYDSQAVMTVPTDELEQVICTGLEDSPSASMVLGWSQMARHAIIERSPVPALLTPATGRQET